MADNRTILLVGRTGNGKSTIANVISNINKFQESEFGVSETKWHWWRTLFCESGRHCIPYS